MTQFYIPRRRLLASSAAGGFVGLIKPVRAGLVPCGTSLGVQAESADATSVTTVGPKIWDALGNSYAISSGGQILFNGTLDHDPGAGVVQIYYHLHQVYQFNGTQWYTRSTPSANWSATTSPISGGGGNNTGITPIFWDDFSEGTMDWTTRWNGKPAGSGNTDQSNLSLQADVRSVRIVHYTDGNFYMLNSAIQTPADAPANLAGFPFQTAEITSKISVTNGYTIGRMKAGLGHGFMGAFWQFHRDPVAQGQTNPDPFQELDFMENPGSGGTLRPMTMTVHTQDAAYTNANNFTSAAGFDGRQWHTYACEWDAPPGNITFYLDGNQVFQKFTPQFFTAPMLIWVSTYTSNGSAWFGNIDATSTWPQNTVYDWIGNFANKAAADTYFAGNPQYSLATGGTDGPPVTGNV